MSKSNEQASTGQKILKTGIISWVIFIVIWGIASLGYDEYFLPSPYETIQAFGKLIADGTLGEDIVASAFRCIPGWLAAIVVAVPLGLLIGTFKPVRWLVEPIVSFFRFVPALALTTLFLMWFGVGDMSKIILIFYASFFPVLINTISGVASVDQSLIEAAQCMGAKKFRVFFTVIAPSAIPYIFSGIRLALGTSIVCIVAAEMMVGDNGLGYLINSSKLFYKTSWSFAGIFTLGILGFLADRLLVFVGRKCLKRFGVKE